MTYTKKTTLKEYTEWLATNPTISEILRVQKVVLSIAVNACNKISSFCKRKLKRRSCLWAKVNEPTTAKPQGIRSTQFPADWGEHPDANYRYRCIKMYNNIQDEIAMEQLFCDGLEIISKK
ncbi:hypothetical protein WAE58_21530 [Pedobacter panaciterrae]|uniref:Transposase n=1 Tax=Pedobacter panaciterrae TaxID=363849 RepID=A0ABU8NTV9_9SPHI